MPKTNKFTATLNEEGSTGSTRGKIPATMINQMGGADGDVIEFEVQGKYIVGGRIIKGKEAQKLRSTRQMFSGGSAKPKAKAEKPAKKAKKGKKQVQLATKAKPAKKAKKQVKSKAQGNGKVSKRKTSVQYSKSTKKAKKGKKSNRRVSLFL